MNSRLILSVLYNLEMFAFTNICSSLEKLGKIEQMNLNSWGSHVITEISRTITSLTMIL